MAILIMFTKVHFVSARDIQIRPWWSPISGGQKFFSELPMFCQVQFADALKFVVFSAFAAGLRNLPADRVAEFISESCQSIRLRNMEPGQVDRDLQEAILLVSEGTIFGRGNFYIFKGKSVG